jgi:hypothetical protein
MDIVENITSTSLKYLEESAYNYYANNLNIAKDIPIKYYYDNITDKKIKLQCLQELFDIGCNLINHKIIIKKNNKFMLDPEFDNYAIWKYKENEVINNCKFLQELCHPLFV